MKILLIEDEVKLAQYLRKGLTEAGHVVDVAHDGVDGLHLALQGDYAALVLDVMLPGIDGFEVCRRLRARAAPPKIILLTARDREVERLKGLDLGADLYVTKPFSTRALLEDVRRCLEPQA